MAELDSANQMPKPCRHKGFLCKAEINRLEGTGQFQADIRIMCNECGEPFRFLGLRSGLDLRGAMCSPDGTEARLAIVPQSGKAPGDHALRGYRMKPSL